MPKIVITGWKAALLAPLAIPIAIIIQLLPLKKTVDRTPADVAKYLKDFIEGTGGDWDWDDFESVPITDPALESIRQRAAQAAPPDPDMARLEELLEEAEALARAEADRSLQSL